MLALSVLPAAADFDLSLPFAQSSAYNTQTAFLDDVAQISGVKTAMFLHDSEVVFDYARRTGVQRRPRFAQVQWSVTKSWASSSWALTRRLPGERARYARGGLHVARL